MPPKTYRARRLANRSFMFAAWRQGIATLHRPPSSFQRLRELTERMREGTDLRMPGSLHAPPDHAALAPPLPRRGAPPTHDWPVIKRLDADFCRTYRAAKGRVPSWKERDKALEEKLGNTKPHCKTLQVALRNSRSI
jgi:hypothetical protein